MTSLSTGSEFGISLATIKLSGGTSVSSDVEIVRTGDSINAMSRAELKKFRKLLAEERTVTFISANAVREARLLQGGGNQSQLNAKVAKLPAGAIKTAPKLAITFQEEDGKLGAGEVTKLFSRLKDRLLLDSDTERDVLSAYREAAGNKKKIAASLTASLAIPPLEVPRLINWGAANRNKIREIAVPRVADALESKIRSAVKDAQVNLTNIGDARDDEEVLYLLRNIDEVIQYLENKYRRVGDRPRRGAGYYSENQLIGGMREVRDSLDLFYNVFATSKNIMDADISNDDLEDFLEDQQRTIVGYIKPFLRAGLPLPEWLGGGIPVRTVMIFETLQEIAGQALGVTPPLILQFQPEGKRHRTFVCPGTINEEL